MGNQRGRIDAMEILKTSLKETGRRMMEMADTISEIGDRDLDPAERKLVRMALLPAIDEAYSELIHFFVMDNSAMSSEAFSRIDQFLGLP